MIEKLKPCPFCGGEGRLFGGDNIRHAYVQCLECQSEAQTHESADAATGAWNRRHSEETETSVFNRCLNG